MAYFSNLIDSYSGEIRKGGLLGKKYEISLFVYKDKIRGDAFVQYGKDLAHYDQFEAEMLYMSYEIFFEQIINIYIDTIEGKESVIAEHSLSGINVFNKSKKRRLILWGIEDPNKWKMCLEDARNERVNYINEKNKLALAERKKEEERRIKLEKDAEQFYLNCYSFHLQSETPVYNFSSGKNEIIAMYVGEDKSINFLQINGYRKEENLGIIPYDKVHYYEKAGNVSYTTDIHGTYSSYGGSFTGARFSKLATAIGGLFFGTMGMTAGALLSYKPAEQTESRTNFSISSDVVKIDDRNVILNFYSDTRKQYIDIELPQDIYNFLQTYLPEKKYGIVEELERKAAVHKAANAIQTGAVLQPGEASTQVKLPEIKDDSMNDFKRKIEKLKMMKEAGLLSDEEFEIERKKLISMI